MAETSASREAWITGIGLATSLGEGLDAHWDALNNKTVNVDETTFAPYVVHPMTKLSFDAQIPKKGDQRQMEAWQRIGTYAAGLALDSAGVLAANNLRLEKVLNQTTITTFDWRPLRASPTLASDRVSRFVSPRCCTSSRCSRRMATRGSSWRWKRTRSMTR